MNKITDKETLFYSILHYLVLGLHIFRGLFLAKYLGAVVFGVYGFIILAQQQISASALGMREATLIELSGLDENKPSFNKIFTSALFFTSIIGALLFILGVVAFFNKENLKAFHPVGEYLYLISFHGVLSISNEVMMNVLRVKGKILYLGFIEVFYGLSIIFWALFIIFFDKSLSVFFQLSLLTNFIVFIIYLFLLRGNLNKKIELLKIFELIKLGVPLLILNVATILMISSGQWIVGFKDSLLQLGIFTFAVSLATVVNYGIGSLTWIYLSPLIAEYKESAPPRISKLALTIRENLFTAFLLLSSAAIIFYFTIIEYFFSEYSSSLFVFLMIFFSQFIQLFCYPDNTLLLAKKKISQVSIICILTTALIYSLGTNFYYFSEIGNTFYLSNIELISIAILFGNFIYMLSIFYLANKYKTNSYFVDIKFALHYLSYIFILIFFYFFNLLIIGLLLIMSMVYLNHFKTVKSFILILRNINSERAVK